jgi:hypothetical protein
MIIEVSIFKIYEILGVVPSTLNEAVVAAIQVIDIGLVITPIKYGLYFGRT